jgi:hypothetical protein
VNPTTDRSQPVIVVPVDLNSSTDTIVPSERVSAVMLLQNQRTMPARTDLTVEQLTGTLTFHNINYVIEIKKKILFKCADGRGLNDQNNKYIIKNISGQFRNGMNAILGRIFYSCVFLTASVIFD